MWGVDDPLKEMSKRAVITMASGLPAWFDEIVLPRMMDYAKRCDAELVILSPEWKGMLTRQCTRPEVRKHGRSLVLDADVIISRNAPNIFEAHPEGLVYMASDSEVEDPDAIRQFPLMVAAQAVCGPIGWCRDYGNSGVILCDWKHSTLWDGWCQFPDNTCIDQINLNYRLRQQFGLKGCGVLDRKWNAFGLNTPFGYGGHNYEMVEFSKRTGMPLEYHFNNPARVPEICHDAYIAHAAGFQGEGRDSGIRDMDKLMP